MFTLSEQARDVVRRIPQQPDQLETAGLRIACGARGGEGLQVRAATTPRRGDEVADFDGARVFVDETARARLHDRILDVRTRTDGRLEFHSLLHDAA